MIVDIGNIIIGKINTLPFIDKISGVVRVISVKDPETKLVKKFPADCNLSFEDCKKGKRYLDLCPDSSKKSVLYLEDNGIRLIKREGKFYYWNAQLNLVCWLNLPKLGVSNCSYSGLAITGILKKLGIVQFNSGIYQFVNINVNGQGSKSVTPFARYSYDETINQFLMYPYDFFVLPLEVTFRINSDCINIEDLQPEKECVIL